MSEKKIDHDIAVKSIRYSYKAFRMKEKSGRSKSQTVDDIVNAIKKEIREDASKKDQA